MLHFLHTRQKLMTFLLMKRITFILQCLCTIWLDMVIIFQINQEADGSLKEMKFQLMTLIWFATNSQSFKYNAALVASSSYWKWKYLCKNYKNIYSIWRSLEIPLSNCKVNLELDWIEDWILSSPGNYVKFKITDTRLHVPIALYLLKIT